MEGAPASGSPPASPPPKRPAGSFPENHYSPGKLYTQFRIADGKSALVWRKTKVFQADASPGSSLPDVSSPSPARPPPHPSRRLDTGDGGDMTPVRAAQLSAATDPLFRANVPASRLLQRLQANKSLPPLVRKRERAYVQRRLLDLVQPRPPPSDAQLAALRATALAHAPLPREHELPELEKRFAKAAAARFTHAAKLGLVPVSMRRGGKPAKPAKGGTHAPGANGKAPTPKRKRAQGEGDEAGASPFPISGGVSKTSGRTLFIPARLRGESAAEKAKRASSGSARKAARNGAGGLRLRAGGEEGDGDEADASLFSPGGSALSPGAYFKERHNVRIGASFQAELPAELDSAASDAAAAAIDDRADQLLWTPRIDVLAHVDVDAYLERLGVLRAAPRGADGGSESEVGGSSGAPALAPSDSSLSIGGLSQEHCLECLRECEYSTRAALDALAREEASLVTWNKPELRKFNVSLKSNGELMEDFAFEANLRVVQQDVRTKSLGQVVHYFYLRGPRANLAQSSQAPRVGAVSPALARTATPTPS